MCRGLSLALKKGLMLSTRSLSTVFWGGVAELPKDSSAAYAAAGRTEGLVRVTHGPSQPLLMSHDVPQPCQNSEENPATEMRYKFKTK